MNHNAKINRTLSVMKYSLFLITLYGFQIFNPLIIQAECLIKQVEPVVFLADRGGQPDTLKHEIRHYLIKAEQAYDVAPKLPSKTNLSFNAPSISVHARFLLTKIAGELPGYGIYTYVLFSRNINNPEKPDKTDEHYQALLKAIKLLTQIAEGISAPKSETNLFCIPSKKQTSEVDDLKNYNSSLAADYLYTTKKLLNDPGNEQLLTRLKCGYGPFLITTLYPISNKTKPKLILYVDLSNYNHQAMESAVKKYQDDLCKAVNKGINKPMDLNNPLIQFVSSLYNANDDIALLIDGIRVYLPVQNKKAQLGGLINLATLPALE